MIGNWRVEEVMDLRSGHDEGTTGVALYRRRGMRGISEDEEAGNDDPRSGVAEVIWSHDAPAFKVSQTFALLGTN